MIQLPRGALLALLVGTFTLSVLLGLGGSELWDFDEGFYAEIAREMAESGDWVVPRFNRAPAYDKPPLVFWLTAVFFKILGTSEFSARLASAVFAIATVALTFLLGDALFGAPAGLIAAVILGTSLEFAALARIGLTDTALTFFVTASLYFLWTAKERVAAGVSRGAAPYLLAGLSTGLGVLAKGPLALALVGSGAFFIFGPRGLLREARTWQGWLSIVVAAGTALPWHVVMAQRQGREFLDIYLGYHNLALYATERWGHGGPWYYYILVVVFGLLPWASILPWTMGAGPAFLGGGPEAAKTTFKDLSAAGHLWFPFGWLLFVFVFFSASSTKAPAYLLPLFPVFSGFLGKAWLRYVRDPVPGGGSSSNRSVARPRTRFLVWSRTIGPSAVMGALAGVFLVGLAALGGQVPEGYEETYRLFFPLSFVMLGFSAVGTLASAFLGRRWPHVVAVGLGGFLTASVLAYSVMPSLNPLKPGKELAALAVERAGADQGRTTRIGSVLGRGGDCSTVFYAGRPVALLPDLPRAAEFVSDSDRPLLLVLESDLRELESIAATKLQVLERADRGVIVRAEAR